MSTTSIRFPIHIEAIRSQNSSGCLSMTAGPGMIPWIIMAPTMRAMTAFDGRPSVSMGMKDVCDPALLAASGAATPSMAPLPNSARLGESFYLHHISGGGRRQRAAARKDSEHGAYRRAPQHRLSQLPGVVARQPQAADAGDRRPTAAGVFQVAQDFGDAEHTDGERDEAGAVGEFQRAERHRAVPV